MKPHRLWIEIVALGTAIACALALLIATLGAAAAVVGDRPASAQASESTPSGDSSSEPQQAYEGMVTCTRCGAKHSSKLGRTAADCTRVCVHGGAGFALVDGEKTYTLEGDSNLLKRIAGQRARVAGVLRGNTIKVSSIASAS
jgi:hypothetical protein